jgi:acetyl-CoA acetyltransferase
VVVGKPVRFNPFDDLTPGDPGVEPRVMGISPIAAIPKLLAQVSLSKDDVDLFEVSGANYIDPVPPLLQLVQINEAFASQFAYCVEQLDIPIEKINPKYVLHH